MSDAKIRGQKKRDDEETAPTAEMPGSLKMPGSRIGQFEVECEIGRGGMGVVYLARDTKLDRRVAIKSLPCEIMDNPKVRNRLSREAKILASLNHPNIATIHDIVEEQDGSFSLVLEYVPGQTLAERIAGSRLKPQEALTIARQIAEAIAAAHEHDVVHRDLKPGNIKITPEGRTKVLDFGLAKALCDKVPDGLDTVTEPGRIIGTPAYMSPEQARGLETDQRCDIWAFGCVLYKMLTGRVPFEGKTTSDTLADILNREPDWHALPGNTPANIMVLLRRCLEKDSRRRLHDIADAAIEIDETLHLPAVVPPVTYPSISCSYEPTAPVRPKPRRMLILIVAVMAIVLSAIVVSVILWPPAIPPSETIRLVVLPFENLGSPDDEYFAAGITDAVTARVATIRGLAVISRQSAMQYKDRQVSPQQIADDLRVDYILEGTIQRERPSDPNSRVRIIPQLISAADDAHVWAHTYDNDLSEVFQVQSDVAERVARGLNIALAERERRALHSMPTESMEAYDYYLRGNDYYHRIYREGDFEIAIRMYDKAIKLDPKFALAHAQLSRCHAMMYWQYYDHTSERLEMAKTHVDEALRLEPDCPEVHLAAGHYYYHCESDWDRALEEFAVARRILPNDSDLLSFIGLVQRRQGRFADALANIKKASELDPLSNNTIINLGETYTCMRNYPEALRCFDKAISLAPDAVRPYGYKASLYLLWEGSTENAWPVVTEALKTARSPHRSSFVDLILYLDVCDGNYQKALDRLSSEPEDIDDQNSFVPAAMRRALIYGYMNRADLAKECYEESRDIVEARIREQPEDARLHSALGIACAGLGRNDEAVREGKLAVEKLPVTRDAMRGICRVCDLARIHVMIGQFGPAVDQIRLLLSLPGGLSIPLLRLDPTWHPLRQYPRFKELLEEEQTQSVLP